MMLALLLLFTALVVLLPMLPAFAEWRRPSDVVPLHIDTRDALDPPFLARSFAQQLAAALARRQRRLGLSRLARVPAGGSWLGSQAERREGASRQVWHGEGDVQLPPDADLLGEVAAGGDLKAAAGRIYRALLAGRRLHIAPFATVLRWAHGQDVDVGDGCQLAGRTTAEHSLRVGSGVAFTLLHAPLVQFGPAGQGPASAEATMAPDGLRLRLGPPDVQWDMVAGRGVSTTALRIGAGRAWRGDLVCQSDLLIGRSCRVRGSIKAWGTLQAEVGCRVVGNLVAVGRITLGADCVVLGAVVSETAVLLGPGCVVGAPGAPATVTAPRIVVLPGVVVHGTLWAVERGSTPAQAPAQAGQAADVGEDGGEAGEDGADGDSVTLPHQVWA
jgi:cytoskeletal protein CcmA (bactofilin family)